MKNKFSSKWIGSRQVRKQRKYRINAPLHTRHKFLSAHLSKLLRDKYGKRSLPLRKGDDVLIMRGTFAKKTGKVSSINLKKLKITIEGIQRTKKDGSKVNVFFAPNVLQIKTLNLDDKERLKKLTGNNSSDNKVKEETPEKKEVKENKEK